MRPRACHTTMKTGARVLVQLRDGTSFVARYREKKSGVVHLDDNRKVKTADLRALSYFKASEARDK